MLDREETEERAVRYAVVLHGVEQVDGAVRRQRHPMLRREPITQVLGCDTTVCRADLGEGVADRF